MAKTLSAAERAAVEKELRAGATGASLAAKYGVSASTISKIKTNLALQPQAVEEKATKKIKTEKVEAAKSKTEKAKKVITEEVEEDKGMKVILSALNRADEVYYTKATTFGQFLTEIKSSNNVAAICKSGSSARVKLEKSEDRLPSLPKGETLYIMLVAIKNDSGK